MQNSDLTKSRGNSSWEDNEVTTHINPGNSKSPDSNMGLVQILFPVDFDLTQKCKGGYS